MLWLCGLCAVLFILVCVLLVRLYWFRKSADELSAGFSERLKEDTNTLITVSSRDRHICALADTVNAQLRLLRGERRRLQNGDLELREAITNISHDLRTPLTALFGYLDLLEQEELGADAAHYLTMVTNRAEALKQLTEELFRYTVLTCAADDAMREEVCLNHALEESLAANYAAFKRCGITPMISLPERKLVRLLHRGALLRIFENILSNAMKYSDGDLEVSLLEDGKIIFANHASQLDDVQVGRLFDRFYTVETAKKSTGLGLSIAKALTEQMHGIIDARYSEGKIIIELQFPAS